MLGWLRRRKRELKRLAGKVMDGHEEMKDAHDHLQKAYNTLSKPDSLSMYDRQELKRTVLEAKTILGRYIRVVDVAKRKLEGE